MSVELFAVNAVSDRIAACPFLAPEVASGDRTPITDGHIDFYTSEKHSKKTHVGRVPVQVKGRITNAKVKPSHDSQSFRVEREVLRFFRDHGGGLYFYVPMRKGGDQREIFYAILLPFKIDRLLSEGSPEQKTYSVKLTRLPAESAKVEGIIRLAWNGRSQSSAASKNDHLLDKAERLTIHSLDGLDESQPTRLALGETDYVVVAHLPGGIEIALDVDLDILPHEYREQDLAVPIICGGIEFANGSGRRKDENTIVLKLSEGLRVRLNEADGKISTNLDLALEGTFREQVKNLDFMIAAAAGNALIIGDRSHQPEDRDPLLEAELRKVRAELARLIELFDELGVDDNQTSSLEINDETKRLLLALHEGILLDRPVRGTSDGSGRYDIEIGAYKIMVVVLSAEDKNFRRITDPFDHTKRDRYRIYGIDEGGSPETVELGTAYETVTAVDMTRILNLRLRGAVAFYEQLEDRAKALNLANLTLLRLLSATDLVTEAHRRDYLLQGATGLGKWLLQEEPDSLIFRINCWQIQHRLGSLSAEDRREIRSARRTLRKEDVQAGLLEACLLILVDDAEELELTLSELNDDDVALLQSWPVWALAKPQSGPADLAGSSP